MSLLQLARRGLLAGAGFSQGRCVHCLAPYDKADLPSGARTLLLCPECLERLRPYAESACASCGRPVTPNSLGHDGRLQCEDCRNDPPPWRGAVFYGLHKGALKDLILRLKFDGDFAVAPLLADFLLSVCKSLPRPDAVAPVPLHPARMRERGYNQAGEIAKAFSRKCRIPCEPALLSRVRQGSPQEGLTASQRRENLRGALAGSPAAKGRAIWIIDDVLTTGSTCREAALALRRAGAKEVRVAFIARANS